MKKLRKTAVFFLVAVLILGVIGISFGATGNSDRLGEEDENPNEQDEPPDTVISSYEEDGSENELYQADSISDWYDLDDVRNDLTSDYELANDLDENTDGYDDLVDTMEGWEPIGDDDNPFTGSFDGDEHEIRDLYINRPNTDYIGLFGYIDDGAEVANLGMVDADVGGNQFVGGLFGWNDGTVENSYSTGGVSGNQYVGGLVGVNFGNVSNSYVTEDMSGNEAVGGLVGYNDGTVENSYVTGDVSGEDVVGGLVGWNNEGTVSTSYATGAVSGDDEIGGLVGQNGGTIENSYSTGEVSGDSLAGGLVGNNDGSMSNSHYNIDEVLINGDNHITLGGIFDAQYQDWIEDKSLDISDYSDTLVPSNDYYEISSVEGIKDLLGFADSEEYEFRLTENIDLTSEPGLYIPYLAADFDGNGHTISNLNIDILFVDSVGMFGHVDHANVSDLGVVDSAVNGNRTVGGLVGENEGTVKRSYADVDVNGFTRIGGLIGRNQDTVYESYAAGDVTGDSWDVGGLVGWNSETIENSYATGDVTGEDDYVGGLVGWNPGEIENSYSTGSVNGEEDNVGGLVGSSTGTVSNSFWDVDTSDIEESDGGTGKTTAEMKDVATYTDTSTEGLDEPWDFVGDPNDDDGDEDIWNIYEEINDGYPFLDWQSNELTIHIEGEGAVEVDPEQDEYEKGTEVVLEAVPDEGWFFSHWEGDHPEDESEEPEITIAMNDDKELTAVFEEGFELTVEIEGEGAVEINPDQDNYEQGTEVTVTANPDEGWGFVEWTGDYEDTEEEITIMMDNDKSITAHFEELDPAYFEVEIIDYDNEIEEGETVTIEYSVTNTGEMEDTQNIIFYVDGEQERVDLDITLEGTETYTGDFTWIAEEAGAYNLEIASEDDQDTVAISVEEDDEIPGFTTILLVSAVIIALAIYKKRER